MTRIDGDIPMCRESDQLLNNELGEMTRIFNKVLYRIENNMPFNDIPENFTLNDGHMKFFYDKCLFILDRYLRLRREYKQRKGIDYSENHLFATYEKYRKIELSHPELCKTWNATAKDNKIVLDRIYNRSKKYVKNHTYYGKVITDWRWFLYSDAREQQSN